MPVNQAQPGAAASGDAREPMFELANYCRNAFNKPPNYDYKLQSKQVSAAQAFKL